MSPHGEVRVDDNPAKRRYELRVGGALAGELRYARRPEATLLLHTEVEADRRGQGLGSELVRRALDDIRRRGERADARCPFAAAYIERHPEYRDLLGAGT